MASALASYATASSLANLMASASKHANLIAPNSRSFATNAERSARVELTGRFRSPRARCLESTQPTRSPLRPGNFTWHHGFWHPPASLMQPGLRLEHMHDRCVGDGPSCTLRLSPSATPVTCQ